MHSTSQTARLHEGALPWAIGVVVLCAFFSLYWHTPLVDDAYITFRYTDFLGTGRGLLYNPTPDQGGLLPVLGTTAPGWAIILYVCTLFGASLPHAALVMGSAAFITCALLAAYAWWIPRIGVGAGLMLIPLLTGSYFVHLTASSGMETGLYCLCILAALYAISNERVRDASLFSLAATSLRPDGLILMPICLYFVYQNKRTLLLPFALLFVVSLGVWAWFSSSYYGDILPHSIQAKRVIHGGTPLINATTFIHFLSLSPSFFILFCGGVLGILAASIAALPITRLSRIALCWLALYILGLVFSGVRPQFFWYYIPPLIVATTIGLPALKDFAESNASAAWLRGLFSRIGAIPILMLLLLGTLTESALRIGALDGEQARHLAYQQVATALRDTVATNEKVFLCETGIIGFALPHAIILDSAGIASKEILAIRRLHPQGYLHAILNRFNPEWVVSPYEWCELEEAISKDWFATKYREISNTQPRLLGGIRTFRRISE